jgi:hypothetical protein
MRCLFRNSQGLSNLRPRPAAAQSGVHGLGLEFICQLAQCQYGRKSIGAVARVG